MFSLLYIRSLYDVMTETSILIGFNCKRNFGPYEIRLTLLEALCIGSKEITCDG